MEIKSAASPTKTGIDINSQSGLKGIVRVVFLKVANKSTSRYGVTIFLFCSALLLLTQAFLALHNGCWIANPHIVGSARERTADCVLYNQPIGVQVQELEGQHSRIGSLLQSFQQGKRDLSESDAGTAGVETTGSSDVKGGKTIPKVLQDLNKFFDEGDQQHIKFVNSSHTEKAKEGGPGNGQQGSPVAQRQERQTNQQLPHKDSNTVPKGGNGDPAQNSVKKTPSVVISKSSPDISPKTTSEVTKKPYIKLPSGSGKPALQPVPYALPKNTSNNIIKMSKETWNTIGCTHKILLYAPTVKSIPTDYKWKEITESYKKHGLGFYLLKCPEQICDLIVRVGASTSAITSSSAVLVGMSAGIMRDKTRAIMEEVKKLTWRENLLKIYLFSLDNSPMVNYYDPYMANFEYHHSMTYHSQADVPIPYGRFHHGIGAEEPRNWAAGKTGLVAWVEDNCDKTFWPRLEYVYELAKHIPVDIYGKCGNRTCNSSHCQEEIKNYKFYLALEEVPCDEFVTLNFWQRGLVAGAVPVVYGGKRYAYEKVAPPDSFVHIGDYDSPAQLAAYLRELSASDAEYNKFHAWRTVGSVEVSGPGFKLDSLCGMVPQLIHMSPPGRRVMSRGKFYRSCRKGIYVNGFSSKGDITNWTPWR